jgi:hypothetical protein
MRYGQKEFETTMRWDESNPTWNESFRVTLPANDDGSDLQIWIMHRAVGCGDYVMGATKIKGSVLYDAPLETEADPLSLDILVKDRDGKKLVGDDKKGTKVTVEVKQRKPAFGNTGMSSGLAAIVASHGATRSNLGSKS